MRLPWPMPAALVIYIVVLCSSMISRAPMIRNLAKDRIFSLSTVNIDGGLIKNQL